MSFRKTILSYLFYLVFCIEVLSALTSSALKINEYVGDQGKNLSIPCNANSSTFIWIKDDQQEDDMKTILENGTLVLTNLTVNNSGIYTCLIVSPENSENSYNYSTIINVDNEENNNLVEFYKARVKIRTPPEGVAFLSARLTTIVGVLMWKFFPNQTGGYAIKCFTADYHEVSDNITINSIWERLDPTNIASNARQLELFGLKPNTTYEFRIYASNKLGPGEIVTTRATTKSELGDSELIRIIMKDAQNFDTRVWIIAVSVFLGTLLILSIGTSVLLCKECRESTDTDDDVDSLELVPNIIFNPGFCESDDQQPSPLQTKTFFCDISDSDDDEPKWTLSKRLSHFFTGDSIKRL